MAVARPRFTRSPSRSRPPAVERPTAPAVRRPLGPAPADLQRRVGNRATGRLLARVAGEAAAGPGPAPVPAIPELAPAPPIGPGGPVGTGMVVPGPPIAAAVGMPGSAAAGMLAGPTGMPGSAAAGMLAGPVGMPGSAAAGMLAGPTGMPGSAAAGMLAGPTGMPGSAAAGMLAGADLEPGAAAGASTGPGAADGAAAETALSAKGGAEGGAAASTSAAAAPATAEGAAPAPAREAAPAGTAAADGAAAVEPGAPEVVELPSPPSAEEAVAPAAEAVAGRARQQRAHRPAAVPVANAAAAARQPEVEVQRSSATNSVAALGAADTPEVPRASFKAALKEAILGATPRPRTEAEADRVRATGAREASAKVTAQLGVEREAAAGPLRAAAATEAPADAAAAQPAAEPSPEPTGAPPEPVSPDPVVPAPLPPERLDYSSDRASTDQAMADAGVTTEQLQRGNEPEFAPALEARSAAEEHEAAAATQYREAEGAMRAEDRAQAEARLGAGLTGMRAQRVDLINQVGGQQASSQTHQSNERRQVTERVNAIKEETRRDVEVQLAVMDTMALTIFQIGLSAAESAYDDAFEEAKGGLGTWLTTWGSDWEEHIEDALNTGREAYLARVDRAIDDVATLVEGKLALAKLRVAIGRVQVATYVAGLDASLQSAGQEALQQVSGEFDALESSVDQRRDQLVQRLTQQFKDSYQRMSEHEEQLREENKSLWQRVYDATIGLIKKIIEFKNLLLEVLAKAVSVILTILSDPIGFLSNLIGAVSLGVTNFKDNIGKHLEKGLLDWIFGAVAGAGIELPETFDLKGVLGLVLQILGLTWQNIRRIAVEMVGEPVVHALEMFAEPVIVLIREGPAGLWEWIKEKLTDLKAMLLDEIQSWLVTNVIEAGIKWVIGLLTPAGAFIKACKAIYDIVMFVVQRASQLVDFVKAVTDSIEAIASGSIGAAAQKIEDALAKAIPVVIGLLASLLGLDDISETIQKFIQKIRDPIEQAIRWLIGKAVDLVKAAGKLLGFGKDEPTAETGDPEHDSAVQAALAAIPAAETQHLEDGKLSHKGAEQVVVQIRSDHPVLKKMDVVDRGTHWGYDWAASPGEIKDGTAAKAGDEVSFAELNDLIAELSTNEDVIDRLSRAREFDIATYRQLQGTGEYGRKGDVLDSDEIIQNAYWRRLLGVKRWSAELKDNPAVALSPALHRQIKNLKEPQIAGLTAQQMLDHHLDQMRPFTPPEVLVVLRREGEKYIKSKGQ